VNSWILTLFSRAEILLDNVATGIPDSILAAVILDDLL
jgi:hypothetical protein